MPRLLRRSGTQGCSAPESCSILPVVGLAEASMLTACMLGRRFAIVTFARALGTLVRGLRRYAWSGRPLRRRANAG